LGLIPGYKASCTDVMDSAFRSCNLGSVINDCEYKHYNKGARKDIPNVN